MRPDALQPPAQRSSIELIIRKRAKLPFPEWISELDNFVKAIKWEQLSKKRYLVRVVKS
jgi:hypothetical protein